MGLEGSQVIITILWSILSLLTALQIFPNCKGVEGINKIVVILIVIFGGPFFAITNILEELLNMILPEGWDDDDQDGPRSY